MPSAVTVALGTIAGSATALYLAAHGPPFQDTAQNLKDRRIIISGASRGASTCCMLV